MDYHLILNCLFLAHLVTILSQDPRETNGQFLLGDPAYTLLDWLMKGYTNSPNITPEQEGNPNPHPNPLQGPQ